MEVRDTYTAEVQRWTLVLAVTGAALLFGPGGGVDAGSVTKTFVVLVAATVAVAVAVAAAASGRALRIPRHPTVALAVVFASLLLARALVSDQVALGLVGPTGRQNGALLYLACAALFAVAAARADVRTWRLLAAALTVTALVVGLSAIDEATLRLGPDWAERPGVAGTLGNANFLAGWAGAVLPVPVLLALDPRRSGPWRVVASVTAVVAVVATVLSGSLQGGFVIVVGLAVLGLVWLADVLPTARWRLVAAGTVAAGALGGVATAAGVTGRGPLAALQGSVGVQLRGEYWVAAGRMVQDAPWTGIGPSRFGDVYRQVRTPEAANLVSLASTTDSAHNVPLHVAAESGIPLAALYVALLVVVAWAAVRGLIARRGWERRWLGAFVAVWVGYVLQSLVSIDVPQLAVLGWVSAGVVVGAHVSGTWHLGRGGSLPDAGRRAVAATVAVVAAAGLWFASLPLRADVASADDTVRTFRTPEGREAESRSMTLAPWQVRYHVRLLTVLVERGEVDRAEGVVRRAVVANPDSFESWLNGARIAVANGQIDLAAERYARARELEPLHPELAREMAMFEVSERGEVDRARDLLEEALQVAPDDPETRQLMGEL